MTERLERIDQVELEPVQIRLGRTGCHPGPLTASSSALFRVRPCHRVKLATVLLRIL